MPLSGNYPVTFSQGRRGEVYVFQGYGNSGKVYSPSLEAWRDVGLAAPTVAPTVTKSTAIQYYVARIDIDNDGDGYNLPPLITISHNGAAPSVPATAISRISNGRLSAVEITNYGKGYDRAPGVSVQNSGTAPTVGSGLSCTATLSGTAPAGSPSTGIVYWEIESTPPGTAFLTQLDQWTRLCQNTSSQLQQVTENGFTCWIGTATGGAGSGAKVRIEQLGLLSSNATGAPACEKSQVNEITSPAGVGVHEFGTGYAPTDVVTVRVEFIADATVTTPSPSCANANDHICPLIIKGYPLGHPKTPKTAAALAEANVAKSRPFQSFTISNGGSQYLKAPELTLLPWTGATADSAFTVNTSVNSSGAITAIDPEGTLRGQRYLIPPVLAPAPTTSGGAKAYAVVRAHLRGKYQCYYRYVNDAVPESEGGPIYSSLSPVREVDCGDGAAHITWSYPAPPEGLSVELWRSTANQAITLFRVAKFATTGAFGSLTDSITDWELVDTTRTGFQAMPILLPNGEINANRFTPPPTNYAVAVMFQDRLWMAVDTAGGNPNTLRFSEVDEAESMPDVNELIIQSNLRSTDYITALIPYAGVMVVAQSRHCHRLAYVAQPLIDAGIFMLAYRGCMNQRCWDIYDGRLYAMDDLGVYSMDPNGQIEDLTVGLFDIWADRINLGLRQWFSVRADKILGVLRVSVALRGDGSTKFPTRQYVYSFDYKTWWEERYPVELTCATEVRGSADVVSAGQLSLIYGTSSGRLRRLSRGPADIAEGSISGVTVTNRGRGYTRPPTITAPGGHGAEFECGINSDGSLTGILIKMPGTKYAATGSLTISPPPAGGVQATATFSSTSGSLQAHWSFKSGCFEYVSDSTGRGGGDQQPRHCSVTYTPTTNSCLLNLQTYYNNARFPRSNVARRDRGTGFVHSDEIPAAVLDMQTTQQQADESHGVARALFSGRVLDDMTGNDRHVSVALSGRSTPSGQVAIHTLDIAGVNTKNA